MALFALSFGVMLFAVAALAVGRLWGAPPLRSCRCDAELRPHCIECPLHRTSARPGSAAPGGPEAG